MNSAGGVATDRRLPQQSQFSSISNPNSSTIINESEFPSLGAKGTASLGGGFSPIPTTSGGVLNAAQSTIAALKDAFPTHRANYATLMRSDPLTNPEFQIQNEDFPALPGVTSGQSPRPLLGEQLSNIVSDDQRERFSAIGVDGVDQTGFGISRNLGDQPMRGIITHPDGEVSNIPSSMLADQFGMAGLVTYLRTVDNPSIVSLALGYDLTTLGLNLNLSERQLYTTFAGPWADNPIKAHELEVQVPDEYMTNTHIRDKLPPVKLGKLSEDVLFYLFYNCPHEVYQIAAACELYQREWRYHKAEGVWLTRSQYGGIKEQTSTYEKGHYNVFDQLQWRKIPKELKLEYKELEERPKLPQMHAHYTPMYAQPQTPVNLAAALNNLGMNSNNGGGTQTPPPSGMMNGLSNLLGGSHTSCMSAALAAATAAHAGTTTTPTTPSTAAAAASAAAAAGSAQSSVVGNGGGMTSSRATPN